ncbi:RNA polymerase-binding protein DksA [Caminibacter mediatlanticus]|uniref:Transcriptional regulator, TraR/DksA family protein n=1 Tax=Caminibacter mediatlanticus TB-2 TaxID=391592 RepID=A0AAI9AHL5_9BACT|nr:RNA polymerase-binding protein DksA [Caminibacter mediatlanticus]EDM23662.1 transcriptional regulator, TraR/DksA family protein [Caminibacter mediatlanticus TB-2]
MSVNIEHFKEILLMRKAELEKILFNISNEIDEISRCDIKDDGDFAAASMDSGRDYQIYLKQKQELKEIEEALKRIEEGSYGICEMCDEPIQEERLKIKPYAKYCIICREIIEKEEK